MIANGGERDHGPITWWGTFPVYGSTLLVALHSICMVAVALLGAAGTSSLLSNLAYSSEEVLGHAALWQLVTYAFVDSPSLWFLVEMYMLFMFGQEVEKFIGRRAFLSLYGLLILLPPLLLTGIAVVTREPQIYAGSGAAHFALFVAFAAIYPGAQMLFGITAKWVAAILVGIQSLEFLQNQRWVPLFVLVAECGAVILYLNFLSGRLPLLFDRARSAFSPSLRRSRASLRPLPDAEATAEESADDIDPLLEKIARHGLSSLTRREKERLEKARRALLAKERQH